MLIFYISSTLASCLHDASHTYLVRTSENACSRRLGE
jgi:hypothetical protein